MNKPVENQKRSFSAIWLLPLVALLVGAWLVYKNYQEQGIMITLRVNDASGIVADKTQVYYKGIPVGKVKNMSVTKDLQHIDLEIEMIKQADERLVEDTKFWIVRPKITINRIAGLDTLIKGSYINVFPGKSKKKTREFIAVDNDIDLMAYHKGKVFNLSSKDTLGHNPGEPVIYKKIKVGEVISSTLYDNYKIAVQIVIYDKYTHLINSSTLFWDISGIKLDVNLPKVNVDVGTFESILSGGIEFKTFKNGKKVEENHLFKLFKNKNDALNSNDILITFSFPNDYGVEEGTKIKYKGITIGEITDVKLNEDIKSFEAKARILPKAKKLLTSDSYFWLVKPRIDLGGVKYVDTIIKGQYISVVPRGGSNTTSFYLHDKPPVINEDKNGLTLILESDKLGSVRKGSPVLYKQFKVGEVFKAELSDEDDVLIHIYIYEKYKNLVKSNTKFWNVSGVRMEGGIFSKIEVKAESISSMIIGGIEFDTPKRVSSLKVKQNQVFKLYDKFNEDWFDNANDLKLILKTDKLGSLKKNSPVLYHQFKVGEIYDTKLSLKDKSILVYVKIFDKYKKLINSSTKFWNISGVKIEGGLFKKVSVETGSIESIVKGGIEFETFDENANKVKNYQKFKLYKNKPSYKLENYRKGLTVTLISDSLGSVKKGNPVLYRQFKVGEIVKTTLSDDGEHIIIKALIFEPYKKFVNSSSKFYNISGVHAEGGLFSKFKIDTGSVESIITGGVAFVTLSNSQNISKAVQNEKFILYESFNKKWLEDKTKDGLELTLLANTLGSIKKGNPILYRQFKVGEVKSTELSVTGQSVLIHIVIYKKYKNFVNSKTKFWNNSGIYLTGGLLSKMSINVGSLETILTGGISFATPDDKDAKPVKKGDILILHDKVEKEWLTWDPYINIGFSENE